MHPTVSWPVAGTVMVEPTESESLGRFERVSARRCSPSRAEAPPLNPGASIPQQPPAPSAPTPSLPSPPKQWTRPYSP